MAESEIEGLSAGLANIHVGASAENAPGRARAETPNSIAATSIHFAASTESQKPSNPISFTPSKDKNHRRVDSQHGGNSILDLRLQPSQSQEDVESVHESLKELSAQIGEIHAQLEGYTASGLLQRKQRIDRSNELRAEIRQCQDKIKYLEERDSMREMELDGRTSNILDNIHFEKSHRSDLVMEVVMSRTFTFSKKRFWEQGQYGESRDYAAIGCIRIGGRLYIAKAGMTREDFGDFINSDHWTTEAVRLSKKIGAPRHRNDATHVEPQLMAFYITRTLAESEHELEDFSNTSIFPDKKSCAELKRVIINVSQRICPGCIGFAISVNRFAKNHGFEFVPTYKKKDT
ncbi:hypothetical protein J4E86_010005 [Alternaria arbusti]|uniref:uncharacterized protein n=1 Tax=Alternaria arbusti TaxID=232088 RepID=UPI00221E3902|nr:uncharacterized protein J4E86_010005 [Alternaria arbusti]KAI4943058.1 hypothetical protein J4E86_010005 [Alternaria arbusti]